jgi:hypothetical protein
MDRRKTILPSQFTLMLPLSQKSYLSQGSEQYRKGFWRNPATGKDAHA